MKSIYDFPLVYEAVLNRPEDVVDTEVRSILEILGKHGIHRGKILELGCGMCPHGFRLVREGFQVVGMDRSVAMLAEAQRRAQSHGINICMVEGDVVDYDLGIYDFEAAIFMYETFPLIWDFKRIGSHFASLHRHMKARGVYIADVDAAKPEVRDGGGEWERESLSIPGGFVESWIEDLPSDNEDGVHHMALHCKIFISGEMFETLDEWHARIYRPEDLALLGFIMDGWGLDGCYSWRGLSEAIGEEDHYLAVFKTE